MEIEEIITKLGELPAMPLVVSEVLNRTEDPTISLSEVSEIIQQDPALTAKILKVSNSPYYGMRQVVGTLKLALVILGVREIQHRSPPSRARFLGTFRTGRWDLEETG